MKVEYTFECELTGQVCGNSREGFNVKNFRVTMFGIDVTNKLSTQEYSELMEVFLSEKIPQFVAEVAV